MVCIVSVYNIKGGVGKSTSAVNLAYLSATAGNRTLIWDLDPQGAATYTLRAHAKVKGRAAGIVSGERELDSLVKKTGYSKLHILPADFSYRRMDTLLDAHKKATKRLLKLMRPLRKRYDYLILDCPPGMTLVSENVIRASDVLVVPLLPSPFSVQMLKSLLGFIEKKNWSDVTVLPFFSMVDRRKKLHKELMESLRQKYPMILDTYVSYASDIEQMSVRRAPLPSYSPRSPAGRAYAELWNEIDRSASRATLGMLARTASVRVAES